MERKPLEQAGRRAFVLVFQTGEEVVAGLRDFARKEGVRGGHFTALGAFREATLAYFDWESKAYVDIPVEEQVEVASLVGDLGVRDGEPVVHAHCVLGRRDGATVAGHLRAGTVRPTLELFLTLSQEDLTRKRDPETGLALLRF